MITLFIRFAAEEHTRGNGTLAGVQLFFALISIFFSRSKERGVKTFTLDLGSLIRPFFFEVSFEGEERSR